ncbi:hypothetical protein [Xanthomonas sacchari]|uniref:hypothetical protein n=1 Tax=Xanthomonas sacchari TaxID=56458 RepID=UPI00225E3725|nr:hypothetical protein [Xanthomonas sacchari]
MATLGLTALAAPPLLAENFADTALFEYGDVRWVDNEVGVIEGENWNAIDRHGDLRWRPVEVGTPLHKLQWFWHPNSDQTLKSVDELVQIWEDSVGRGGQLVLGIAPDKRGLLPRPTSSGWRKWARRCKRATAPIATWCAAGSRATTVSPRRWTATATPSGAHRTARTTPPWNCSSSSR